MEKVKIAVLVSGGGTNLQALIDAERCGIIHSGTISLVISNVRGAYALTRAENAGIDTLTVSKKELGSQEAFEEKLIAGKNVYVVDENDLIACFDENITEEVVKTIAQMKPLYAVLRDNSFSSDTVAANFDQIFATYSPNTTRKVL